MQTAWNTIRLAKRNISYRTGIKLTWLSHQELWRASFMRSYWHPFGIISAHLFLGGRLLENICRMSPTH